MRKFWGLIGEVPGLPRLTRRAPKIDFPQSRATQQGCMDRPGVSPRDASRRGSRVVSSFRLTFSLQGPVAGGCRGLGGITGTRKLSRGEEGANGSQNCPLKTLAMFLPRRRLR